MLPIQSGFFQAKTIGDTQDKLTEIYSINPDVMESEKRAMIEYWKSYEGLDNALGDKSESFSTWFYHATSPETITRCLRALKQNGIIAVSNKQAQQSQAKEQQFRTFWGNQSRLRGS